MPCVTIFVKDPAGFMNALELSIPCAVNDRRKAMIDTDHMAHVNYEVFFFSGDKEREKFVENPLKYCGIVTDPVNRQRFIPTKSSPRIDFDNRPFYFMSDSTMALFQEHSDSLAWPEYKMIM